MDNPKNEKSTLTPEEAQAVIRFMEENGESPRAKPDVYKGLLDWADNSRRDRDEALAELDKWRKAHGDTDAPTD
jgi:hypothetical protein